MSINFIPNDPDDVVLPMRVIAPSPNRPTSRAGFDFIAAQPEGVFDPGTQTAGFLFWQCREAALRALAAWEDAAQSPFSSWQQGKKIDLDPDVGVDLNAFYNRASLQFFHFTTGGKTFLSGASTDVVAHEAGHGILDALRPDLWDSALFEVNSAHEGFGDCVAILTALLDGPTRAAVLASIKQKNLVESTAENLAAGIAAVQANHNAAVPRRARNNFKWQLPATLPSIGSASDGPGKLVNEIHSFGQLLSGCFYDSIVNIFYEQGGTTEAHLASAARTAGRLLAESVANAPEKARFFREIGRGMVKADEQLNNGANRDAVKAAFEGHDITLGTGAMTSPVAALAGAAPKIRAAAATLGPAVKKDLLSRLRSVGGKLVVSALNVGAEKVAEAIHERLVPLGGLSGKLKGVVARASESVLVGDSGGRAAVLGSLPDPAATIDEVETFVRSLLTTDAIDFGGKKKAAVRGVAAVVKPRVNAVTHAIKMIGGKKTLVRLRFACGCRARA